MIAGQRHMIRVVPATDLEVERIDGGRMDAHPYLAGSDLPARNLAQLESIGPSETGEHDGLHQISHLGVPPRGLWCATRADGRFSPVSRARSTAASGGNANIREDSDTTVARRRSGVIWPDYPH